jgi:hypothetical protein
MTVRYSSKSSGNLKVIGEIKLAKTSNANTRLKIISPYLGKNLSERKYPMDAKTVPNIHAPKRFTPVMISEKSYMNSSLKTA